jgi:hypothetical protein
MTFRVWCLYSYLVDALHECVYLEFGIAKCQTGEVWRGAPEYGG